MNTQEPTVAEREARRLQERQREEERARRHAFVEHLWRETWDGSQPLAGSPILRWLQVRGIDDAAMDLDRLPLRWAPTCARAKTTASAMVARMTDPVTADPCGIHRTFL